jgi:hypothetical protein
LIINEIKISCLTAVPSLACLVETNALSRRVFPSGNGDIVWVLTEQIPPHPYLRQILLVDRFRIESRSVVALTVSFDSRDSIGHSIELCEHPPAAHAVENGG